VADEPAKLVWQADLAAAHEQIGDVLEEGQDLAGALRSYRQSVAILQGLTRRDRTTDQWSRDLAESQAHLQALTSLLMRARGPGRASPQSLH
jgi:hypothetical protein